jgi:thiamine pyrophosphate-dependent enzyme/TAT (twin-arginine translocation) pathway-exported protein
MPKRRNAAGSSRRNFLKGAGLVGAATTVTPPVAGNAVPVAAPERLKAALPGPRQIAAETMAPARDPVNQTSSGGDFMADVLNSLGIEYFAINCASSYRGLHEAIVNHSNNKPEIITCVYEDIGVHMAQGYAKIEGKPMAMGCHGVVGLQHATMAMYNAWCDCVPVIVIGGNIMEADKRAPGAEWLHAGVDIGQIVREFTKWDDQPASLQHFAESATRLQDRDDAADGPGISRARRRAAGESDPRCGKPAHSQACAGRSAARRFRGNRRSGEIAGQCAEPGHRLRPRGAHARRHGEPRGARRGAAMRRHRQCRPHEFSVTPSAQSKLPPRAGPTSFSRSR